MRSRSYWFVFWLACTTWATMGGWVAYRMLAVPTQLVVLIIAAFSGLLALRIRQMPPETGAAAMCAGDATLLGLSYSQWLTIAPVVLLATASGLTGTAIELIYGIVVVLWVSGVIYLAGRTIGPSRYYRRALLSAGTFLALLLSARALAALSRSETIAAIMVGVELGAVLLAIVVVGRRMK